MNISVYGDNLTALVTASCLAEKNNVVKVHTFDSGTATELSKGQFSINEPFLDKLFTQVTKSGNLIVSTNLKDVVGHGEIQFFSLEKDDVAQLNFIIDEIIISKPENLIIVFQGFQSVGTCDDLCDQIQLALSQSPDDVSISCAVVPSFLKEGTALENFREPDRIIIGCKTSIVTEKLKLFFNRLSSRQQSFVCMSPREAEFTRVAVNSLLAIRLSLVNEMANAAEQFQVDIKSVLHGIGQDVRIGSHYLSPGCGYGGQYLESHIQEFAHLIASKSGDPGLLLSALKSNESQKEVLFRKIWRLFKGDLTDRVFAFWGMSFKPESSNVTCAPSVKMAQALLNQGAILQVYDPLSNKNFMRELNYPENLSCMDNAYDAVNQVDALIVLTEWDEFLNPDFKQLKDVMKTHLLFDGRNIYEPEYVESLGFSYYGIGRGRLV